jgi:putative metalloprotease
VIFREANWRYKKRRFIDVRTISGSFSHSCTNRKGILDMGDEETTVSRRHLMAMGSLLGGISFATPAFAQFGLGKVIDVASDVAKSESITDDDIKNFSAQMAVEMDRDNPVAGPKDPYGKRLAMLTRGITNQDGVNLNIKAYLVKDVNAFAMADGTVRIFAGLMDKFTDDEIRYVIGHERGHVRAGHTKKRMQAALRTSALKKGVGAAGGTAGRIAASELGGLFEKVITAQHSQGNEKEADDLAMAFMKSNKFDPMACVTALEKLGGGSGGGVAWLQTHPSPKERAARMRKQLAA